METVFLLWVTEEDGESEHVYLDDIYGDHDRVHDRAAEMRKRTDVVSANVEERLLK